MKPVNWSVYAGAYDIIPRINPAYRELVEHCVATVGSWPLCPGDVVADIGGGTGNFSIALAVALPTVTILHADFNRDMLGIARRKAGESRLQNWRAAELDVAWEEWGTPPLAGIVSVHCLYSFPSPQGVIRKMAASLRPGGFLYACDLGRMMNTVDWTLFLLRDSLRTRGLKATLGFLLRAQEIRRQNQAVARGQKRGEYWTHNLAEFRASFEGAGIEVLSASDTLYRGYDDFVVGRKVAG